MSKIKNDGLDQYGTEAFEQQQFGTAGVEEVNRCAAKLYCTFSLQLCNMRILCIYCPMTAVPARMERG